MKLKTIILTIFLITGFSFLTCVKDSCSDSPCPPFLGDYFDIQDIDIVQYKRAGNSITPINEGEIIPFNEFRFMRIDYLVEYHSCNYQLQKHPFSIVNTAYGCSCQENGFLGSKEEKLENLTIITLNDFNNDYLQNDTINDLFSIHHISGVGEPLSDFLTQDSIPLTYEDMSLELLQKPQAGEDFKVKVIMELSNNDVYESESISCRLY